MHDTSSRDDDRDRHATDDTSRHSPSASGVLATGLALALTVVALTGGFAVGQASPVGSATAHDSPSLAFEDVSLDPGETGSSTLVLSSTHENVSGYDLTLAVSDPSVATIQSVTFSDEFALTDEDGISDDGREVSITGADSNENVQAGATDVPFVTVELRGESDGETSLSVGDGSVSNHSGAPMSVSTVAGTVTVGDPSADSSSSGSSDDSSSSGSSSDDSSSEDSSADDSTEEAPTDDESTEADGETQTSNGGGQAPDEDATPTEDGSSDGGDATETTSGTGPTGLWPALAVLALAGLAARVVR